ncbi:membrane-bound PQQ-dependent dehydrogenase, glucose/quinate/shikimate family [Acinetobacter equi]|uniref:Pyrrolo-quinoline quinone repeat domain-containing protein n=1 Tax=Acinetobacter equi TaxID=1324350 RepID=A0A0N9W0N1_9GAMM|nr:membrane-bound PQQ-dependent dehydrogenase, glucose/quinate/shikimate family [Acinetobacter equi]ALH96111.1 hypothetical protein AOY20_11525 [Acinetobacter equi]
MNDNLRSPSKIAYLVAVIYVVFGLAMLIGGIQLVMLSGSPYFVIAGFLITLSGFFLWRRSTLVIWTYSIYLLLTLVWTLLQTEIDFWIYLGRLALPFGLGVLLLLPMVRQHYNNGPNAKKIGRVATAGFSLSLIVIAIIGFINGDPAKYVSKDQFPDVKNKLPDEKEDQDWVDYGNDKAGTKYSKLTQITPENVNKLKVAWMYRTGDYPVPKGQKTRRLEVTPLKVDDSLYLCSARNDIIALDAETGQEKWRYYSKPNLKGVTGSAACRGVAYYKAPELAANAECSERIFTATVDARLIAIDAKTGKACSDFGQNGVVDLKRGMGKVIPGYYYVSSAPQVVRGNVVLGGWVSDGQSVQEPAGVIRGFNAVTGKFAWAFDYANPDDQSEPTGDNHYTRGTANSWGPISADEKLGLVYLPIGNATPDYFGTHRTEADEKYSSGVFAINAETGKLDWHFQTTHHDLWDYDNGSQPTLVDLTLNGQNVPSMVLGSKRGQIYVLDRITGKPVKKVEEVAVPQGGLDPKLAKTQPYSTEMPQFDGLRSAVNPENNRWGVFGESNMWGVTPLDEMYCRIKFKQARFDGSMTPPDVTPYIQLPGSLGGQNWGGLTVDPERQIAYIPYARLAMYNYLIPRQQANKMGIHPDTGRGEDVGGAVAQAGLDYAASIAPFLSPLNAPCTAPPYGQLAAVDLQTNKIIWNARIGTSHDTGPLGIKSHLDIPLGTQIAGGSLVTRSGLVFMGAASEEAFRAFDAKTGKVIWKDRLLAAPNATPMTYVSPKSNKQFVVIAAGGHTMLQTKPGDYIIAYTLEH